MTDAIARAKTDIETHGWHWVAVGGEAGASFLFTIGLWTTYRHPEIVIFSPNLDPATFHGNVSALVRRVAAGEVLAPGRIVEQAFGRHAGAVRDVAHRWLPSFLGTAVAVHGGTDFPVVQLFWPDGSGRFPWQSGFAPSLLVHQPLLFEPNLLLAMVGFSAVQRFVEEEEGLEVLQDSLRQLFLPAATQQAATSSLGEWHWRIGQDLTPLALTPFGDFFLTDSEGRVFWLGTAENQFEHVGDSQGEWIAALANRLPDFWPVSTLFHARDLGWDLASGQVFSWRQSPLRGGSKQIENLERLDAAVHVAFAAGLAKHWVPPS